MTVSQNKPFPELNVTDRVKTPLSYLNTEPTHLVHYTFYLGVPLLPKDKKEIFW